MAATNNEVRVASLFSGCGGMDLGFAMARSKSLHYKTVWAVDVDKDAVDTYRNNLNPNIICENIWNIDISKIPDIDVIIGGFPCQDFSVLRGDKRHAFRSKRGLLYRRLVETVKIKQPMVFIAENVKGLLSVKNGRVMETIKKSFSNQSMTIGYELHTKVINFADFGVPQLRERLIIVGVRTDLNMKFKFPEATHKNNYVSVRDAFDGVDNVQFNNTKAKISKVVKEMISEIPPGGNYKDSDRYKDKNWMSFIYRKLDPKKPSPTVIAAGGGGTGLYHYKEPRAITNRERARLQSFPDNFIFCGNGYNVRRQIGNAVPPLGIKPIANEILNSIAKIN